MEMTNDRPRPIVTSGQNIPFHPSPFPRTCTAAVFCTHFDTHDTSASAFSRDWIIVLRRRGAPSLVIHTTSFLPPFLFPSPLPFHVPYATKILTRQLYEWTTGALPLSSDSERAETVVSQDRENSYAAACYLLWFCHDSSCRSLLYAYAYTVHPSPSFNMRPISSEWLWLCLWRRDIPPYCVARSLARSLARRSSYTFCKQHTLSGCTLCGYPCRRGHEVRARERAREIE